MNRRKFFKMIVGAIAAAKTSPLLTAFAPEGRAILPIAPIEYVGARAFSDHRASYVMTQLWKGSKPARMGDELYLYNPGILMTAETAESYMKPRKNHRAGTALCDVTPGNFFWMRISGSSAAIQPLNSIEHRT